MGTQRLRGALIGCGFFGNIQLEAWRRMEDVEIAAACDPVLDKAQTAAPQAFADAREMLDRVPLDFVDIATRPDTHLPLVRLCVERGIACICQKPMAESLADAVEMVRLVGAGGVRVMMHENWRWQPWYREARRLMEQGAIGQPLTYTFRIRQRDGLGGNPYPNQPYFRRMPRLLVFETLIHPIDTARFLFGDIASVQAHVRRHNPLIQGEDRAVLILGHWSGMDGIVDGHRFANPEPPGPAMGDTVIEGDDGTLRILATGDIYCGEQRVFSHPSTVGYKGDSVLATQQHFVDCLREGRAFETGPAEYLSSYAASEAAYRSATEGRVVRMSEMELG